MYKETTSATGTTIEIACDARKGKFICGNSAEVTMPSRDSVVGFIYALGFRLLRRHQVCAECEAKKRVTFPRTQKAGAA